MDSGDTAWILMSSALVLPSLVSLGMLLVEFAVAVGMIWMAIWWLARV